MIMVQIQWRLQISFWSEKVWEELIANRFVLLLRTILSPMQQVIMLAKRVLIIQPKHLSLEANSKVHHRKLLFYL